MSDTKAEIEAIQSISRALAPLDVTAMQRVLEWARGWANQQHKEFFGSRVAIPACLPQSPKDDEP